MKRASFIIISFLFIINLFVWKEVYSISKSGFLEVYFFDIGQGDSTFIKTPKGRNILIDGGPNSALLEKLSKVIPFYEKNIDLIILTHPHSDHIRGLISVLESYNVNMIIWSGAIEAASDFNKWENILENKENVYISKAGLRIYFGKTTLDILYPFDPIEGEKLKDNNIGSIVTRVSYGDRSFIFTGDAYKNTESELILKEKECKEKINKDDYLCKIINLDSDVLQVGHHGSKTSTSKEFIISVSPSIAVISVGKDNIHGHPNEEVLARLNDFGINTLRTDVYGDIKIITNGSNLELIY